MTDANSWWARKLGRAPSEMPAAPSSYAPTGYAPGYAPPVGPAQVVPQPAWSDPAGGPQTIMIEDPNAPGGKRFNWRSWRGGQGNREETSRCPQCGGTNYFSRRQNQMITKNGAAHPAPQCFDCSYNGGLFQIFGGN